MLDKLPQVLLDAVNEASAKIGAERAMIALQGIIHLSYPIRIIDGVLRQEVIDGINHIMKTNEVEAIALPFIEKVETRFPGTFELDEEDLNEGEFDATSPVELDETPADVVDDEDLVPVVSPRRRKKSDG